MNPSGGPIKSVIRDADCFEQITDTEASYQGHALHKTGKTDEPINRVSERHYSSVKKNLNVRINGCCRENTLKEYLKNYHKLKKDHHVFFN